MKTKSIKNWYCEAYPDDENGKAINPLVTFMDVWIALNMNKNYCIGFYTLIGVIDATIRDRIFKEMVERKYCYSTDRLMTMFLFGNQIEV